KIDQEEMDNLDPAEAPAQQPSIGSAAALRRQLGTIDLGQVKIWRQMTPAQKLAILFQAHRFALQAVRVSERRLHPDLSPEELAWRVTRRMQGNPRLGRISDATDAKR
ncbi:MAG: hypothetical protein M3Q45_10275, partial [Chloroflexota bacterium]|nr:hypothetical protein [Chloroflexota bacterium]